jgi:dienelactone hydrolase
MKNRPRIKRIDKIGSTADIPYTRTNVDVKGQRWVIDRFYRLMGKDALFWAHPGESLGWATMHGGDYTVLKDTAGRIGCLDMAPKENIRTAKMLERLGSKEEDAGHPETACQYHYQACRFYAQAAWGIFDSDNKELIWLTEKIKNTFDKVIQYSKYPIERVEIPFEGKSLPAILSLTPSRKKAPTIIAVPGMDAHKETTVNHLDNPFITRGMNSLIIDGPGQGESLVRKIWVDEENYGRAGKAAIDYLVRRPEVDANKIGVQGSSMGTYWGPLIAIHDDRVKALATRMSNFYTKDHIFNETSPNFRLRFMYMAGNLDDEEFDRLATKMTLEDSESQIRCPHIIFHGEFDHLTTTEEVYKYFNRLGSEIKELRIYENQYHSIYRFAMEVVTMSADWLRDRLNGVAPAQKRKIVLVDWNRQEHPVDEEALVKGFSYIKAD